VLEDAGYTNVAIASSDIAGCPVGNHRWLGSTMEMTGFTATGPSGRPIKGTICGKTFGGYSINLY